MRLPRRTASEGGHYKGEEKQRRSTGKVAARQGNFLTPEGVSYRW